MTRDAVLEQSPRPALSRSTGRGEAAPAPVISPPPRDAPPRNLIAATAVHFALLVAAIVSLVPFLWLICASLKRGEDLFTYTFLPWDHLNRLTTGNYTALFRRETFGRWLINSLFLSSAQTVIVVTLSSLGGFAL